jgi:hypothetical protein
MFRFDSCQIGTRTWDGSRQRRRREVDEDGLAFRGAVRLIRRGQQPPPGAPEPQSGLDSSSLETWQIEDDVCERLGRMLRRVDRQRMFRARTGRTSQQV